MMATQEFSVLNEVVTSVLTSYSRLVEVGNDYWQFSYRTPNFASLLEARNFEVIFDSACIAPLFGRNEYSSLGDFLVSGGLFLI